MWKEAEVEDLLMAPVQGGINSREPETISEFILSCDHCISMLAVCKVHSSAADEWRKTEVRVQLSHYFGHHLQFSHNVCA